MSPPFSRPGLVLTLLLLLPLLGGCFELQDTIHALMEENIHLHDQLENLTQALRKLRRVLWHHSNDPAPHEHHKHHSEDMQHLWDEWSQQGVYGVEPLRKTRKKGKVL